MERLILPRHPLRAENSKATAPPAPTLNEPNPKTHTGFTIGWTAGALVSSGDGGLGMYKQDNGTDLTQAKVSYVVYYTSTTTKPTNAEIKAAGGSDTPTSGNVPVVAGTPKTASASGKAFVHTVYIVLEAINTTDPSKTKLSGITEYPVTGATTTPTVPTVNVIPRKDKLTVRVTALTAGDFGTTDNGTPLDADTVKYVFYYAKKGVGISDKKAEAATAAELYAVLKTLADDGDDNTANKGKVVLTTGTGNGLGSSKEVTGLTPVTDYHYTVRVEETATPDNGANTPKAKVTTNNAAAAGTGTDSIHNSRRRRCLRLSKDYP